MTKKSKTPIRYAETQYGFEYGATKVERCASDDRGYVVLCITTPRGELIVTSTPTGLLSWEHRKAKK